MDPKLQLAFDRVERRLALMRDLAATLEQAQAAVLAGNLEMIEAHTVRQRDLCEALRQLTISTVSAGGRAMQPPGPEDPAAESPSPKHEQWSALLGELAEVESRVGHLNRVHAALLRRAQRSLAIVSRLLASSEITYSPPAAAGGLGERR
jgi:hypothetical protein